MNDSIKMAGAAVVGAGVGFFVGFKVLEKKMEARFDERLETETKDMREFYETVRQPYASPEEAVKDLIPPASTDPRVANGKVQYNKVVPQAKREEKEIVPTPPAPVENVFENEGPKIISQDVFMENDTEPEHVQTTLTYYEKDDQLCGENDEPIDNPDLVAGLEFKTNFGTDSSDPNVVHIRNNKLQMDFEIVRSMGSYVEEVLGGQPDTSVPPHKRVGR